MSSLTSSDITSSLIRDILALPVGSMDEPQCVDDGQRPIGPPQQQQRPPPPQQQQQYQHQQMARYPTQQQSHDHAQAQAHWYGSDAQPMDAHISQPSQQPCGYSSSFVGSSYHAHHADAPKRSTSLYAGPILPTTPLVWASSSGTQGQEKYSYPASPTYSQLVQAHEPQQPYITPMHATGTSQVHIPAGPFSNVSGLTAQSTPIALWLFPQSATAPLPTRPVASPAGSNGGAGSPAPVTAPASQVPHGGDSRGTLVGMSPTAPVLMGRVIDVSGEAHFEGAPSQFPPELYPVGENAASPCWPTRKTEKLYGSRLDQVRRSCLF
jgi:hypothetical protein